MSLHRHNLLNPLACLLWLAYAALMLGVAPCGLCAQEEGEHESQTEDGNESTQKEEKPSAAKEGKERLQAVLVMDSSGSMLLTDPKRLRYEGAKLLVEFLRPGDSLGIVEFSSQAKVIRPLQEFQREQVEGIQSQLDSIESKGEYTDLLSGVVLGRELLEKSADKDAQQVLILLSDGKMDPDPQFGSANSMSYELLNQRLPELKSAGIRLFSLAFSELADRTLLGQMAAATEGQHWFTPDAGHIHESFADLFVAVKKPQMLQLTGKGFKIDSDISEATFYINRDGSEEVKVIAPSGAEISAQTKSETIRWFHGQKFDVVTILQPEVGQWQVAGLPRNDGFATVLTNLKLVLTWPPAINANTPALLEARLNESEKPVALPEMSGVTKYAFRVTPTDKVSEPIIKELLYDDGTQGDRVAGDGVFSSQITLPSAGEYRLQVIAQSPTFERSQQLSFRAKPALVALTLVAVEEAAGFPDGASEEGHAAAGGAEHKEPAHAESAPAKPAHSAAVEYFRVELSEEAAQLKKIQLKLQAVDEKRRIILLPIKASRESSLRYETPARYLKNEGHYQLKATLSGEGRNKREVRATSLILEYSKSTKKISLNEEPEVLVVEEEKEVKPVKVFPLIELAILFALNSIVGFVLFSSYRKALQNSSRPVPNFEAPRLALQGLALLEGLAALNEVDLSDPLLSAEEPVEIYTGSTAEPAPAAEAPADEAAPTEDSGAEQAAAAEAENAETNPPPEESTKENS